MNLLIEWPQIIYVSLTLIGLGVVCANDGRPKTGNVSAFASIISTALIYCLLYWGGFFTAP